MTIGPLIAFSAFDSFTGQRGIGFDDVGALSRVGVLPTAQSYSFGHLGVNAVVFNIPLQAPTKENGHLESLDRHVTPRSLYLAQLRDRLGDDALRQVATAAQLR